MKIQIMLFNQRPRTKSQYFSLFIFHLTFQCASTMVFHYDSTQQELIRTHYDTFKQKMKSISPTLQAK